MEDVKNGWVIGLILYFLSWGKADIFLYICGVSPESLKATFCSINHFLLMVNKNIV